jgi:hypothetical protein
MKNNQITIDPNIMQVCDLENNILCHIYQTKKYLVPYFDNLCDTPFIFKHDQKPEIIKVSIGNGLYENIKNNPIEDYVNINTFSLQLQSEIKKELLLKNLLK